MLLRHICANAHTRPLAGARLIFTLKNRHSRSSILLRSQDTVPVNASTSEESMLHHALRKPKKGKRQRDKEQDSSHLKPRSPSPCGVLTIQIVCHPIALVTLPDASHPTLPPPTPSSQRKSRGCPARLPQLSPSRPRPSIIDHRKGFSIDSFRSHP